MAGGSVSRGGEANRVYTGSLGVGGPAGAAGFTHIVGTRVWAIGNSQQPEAIANSQPSIGPASPSSLQFQPFVVRGPKAAF